MSDNSELEIPVWNRRRWILFKRAILQPEVSKAVSRYQKEFLLNDTHTYPLWALFPVIQQYLPDGCDDAYTALLNKPGITDQELLNLIEPPVKIISHVNKHIGLSDNPAKDYERYMHKIGADELPEGVDGLYEEDTGLYLRISPRTNRTELKAFITEYFKDEMEPHLDKQPEWDTKRSNYMDNPNSKTRSIVAESEPILQRILALKSKGKTAPQIRDTIDREFGKYIDEQNIRKMISNAKKHP